MPKKVCIDAPKTNGRKLEDRIWNRLLELAWSRGIETKLTNVLPQRVDGLFLHCEGHSSIVISTCKSRSYKCFVFGHELGHYANDIGNPNANITTYQKEQDLELASEDEKRADRFSRKLLYFVGRGI